MIFFKCNIKLGLTYKDIKLQPTYTYYIRLYSFHNNSYLYISRYIIGSP